MAHQYHPRPSKSSDMNAKKKGRTLVYKDFNTNLITSVTTRSIKVNPNLHDYLQVMIVASLQQACVNFSSFISFRKSRRCSKYFNRFKIVELWSIVFYIHLISCIFHSSCPFRWRVGLLGKEERRWGAREAVPDVGQAVHRGIPWGGDRTHSKLDPSLWHYNYYCHHSDYLSSTYSDMYGHAALKYSARVYAASTPVSVMPICLNVAFHCKQMDTWNNVAVFSSCGYKGSMIVPQGYAE